MVKNITALFIFEALGRPADHLKGALESVIEVLNKQEGVKVNSSKVHEPKPLSENEKFKDVANAVDLFSTFAEVEVEVDNINLLFTIVTNMLPANVEIIEPEEFRLKNFDLTAILSDLTMKIHQYDEIAKASLFERKNLTKEIEELKKKIKQ